MTRDEFLSSYHEYCVKTREEALDEIEKIEIVGGHTVEPMYIPDLGWCLMLGTAAEEIRRIFPEWPREEEK